MAAEDEYEGGPDQIEEAGGLDEELAEQRAAALRASLADYDLDEDAELLAGFTAGGEVVEMLPALPVVAIVGARTSASRRS
jgi:GTP-binding protein